MGDNNSLNRISELFLNLGYDTADSSAMEATETTTMPADPSKNSLRVIKTKEIDTKSFFQFIKNNADAICDIEQRENFKTKRETKRLIDVALEFMGYYEKKNLHIPVIGNVIATSNRSILEVILALYRSIDKAEFLVVVDLRRYHLVEKVFRHYFGGEFMNYKLKASHLNINEYSSMLVFDSADLGSASDAVAAAFEDNSSPWKVRNLLIQESCYEKFMDLVMAKIRPYNDVYAKDVQLVSTYNKGLETAKSMGLTVITQSSDTNELKPTFVVGQNRKYFDQIERANIPVFVNINVFRTAKEAASLFNSLVVPYASIWSESISLTYELVETLAAPTIWINCIGKFTPKTPMGLGTSSPLLFGNEVAIVDKLPQNEHIKPSLIHEKQAIITTDRGFYYQWYTVRPKHNVFYDESTKNHLKIENFYGKKFLVTIHNLQATLDLIQNESLKKLYEDWMISNHKLVITAYGVTFAN